MSRIYNALAIAMVQSIHPDTKFPKFHGNDYSPRKRVRTVEVSLKSFGDGRLVRTNKVETRSISKTYLDGRIKDNKGDTWSVHNGVAVR